MAMDTFGCTKKFLPENPKAARALADSYFEAWSKYLRWQDRAANAKFAAGEHAAFSREAA